MEPPAFSDRAPAKINLFLLVTGKRPDGYHLLDSLVVFADACDTLRAAPAEALWLSFGGPFGASLAAEPDNLVLRAARALASATGVRAGARLHLDKNLPIASGIGGGSSDAAAALRLLARLWGVTVPEGLAATLGADVPVCFDPRPRRMSTSAGPARLRHRAGQSGPGFTHGQRVRRQDGGVFATGGFARRMAGHGGLGGGPGAVRQ
jgi:4-diphosphocytidyl-2C-methyl-D-erythritol kinase